MESIIDKYKEKFEKLTEKMKALGQEMGWMANDPDDPDGMFGPIMREGFNEASELELAKMDKEADAKKSLEFLYLFAEWCDLKEKIETMEKTEEGQE